MLSVGLIRVISLKSREKQETHARLMMRSYPSLKVFTEAIEGFPDGLYNDELVAKAIPAILQAAEKLVPQVDALAVSCAEDPGVAELRKRYQIPVIGAGSALAWACQTLGKKVGVLTITENLPSPLQTILMDHSVVWRQVKGVRKTTDLQNDREAIIETASILIEHGCEAIALGCTGLSTVGAAGFLAEQLGVPVLDPVLAMGGILATMAQFYLDGKKEVVAIPTEGNL